MFSILTALLGSLATTLVAVPLVRRAALACDLVDRPDARRKLHGRTVPLGGGLAVFLGWVIPLTALAFYAGVGSPTVSGETLKFGGLAAACALLVALGLYDDWRDLRGRQKLAGQVLAVGLLIVTGTLVRKLSVLGYTVELGLLAGPFTAFFLLGAINAVNLLDGIDGLASTVGVILGTAFCAMSLMSPHGLPTAMVAASLVGALLAFLFFNFPPAKIFLGDAGSMLIGLALGFVAVHSNFKEAATMALAAPVAVWSIPIFDVAMAIVRRKLAGRSIYVTDRGHLHHRLGTELNLSGPRVLLVVSVLCGITAVGAVVSVVFDAEWVAVDCAVLVLVGMIGTRLFGFTESVLLAKRTGGAALSLVPGRGPVVRGGRQRLSRLRGTHEWEELWGRLLEQTGRFGLASVELDVNHPALREDFSAGWTKTGGKAADRQRLLRADLPLVGAHGPVGWLRVTAEHTGDRAADRLCDLMGTLTGFETELLDLLDHQLPAERSAAAAPAAAECPAARPVHAPAGA